MRLLEAAGLPPGVINLVTGYGQAVSEVALPPPGPGRDPLHRLDRRRSSTCGGRSARTSPATAATRGWSARPAARTSSIAHPSADPGVLSTALVRGAFEYQGQKCSAASRAYVPRSVWTRMQDELSAVIKSLTMGDVAADLSTVHGRGHRRPGVRPARRARWPGQDTARDQRADRRHADDADGYFVQPTVLDLHRPDRRGVHHRVLRPDPRRARLRRRRLRRRARPRPPTSPRTR